MKIHHHNAPSLLLENTRALADRYHSWRCIYISLADRRGDYSHTVLRHFVIDGVTHLLEACDGTIYVCDDGDMFILFQGALKPILARLGRHFDGIVPLRLEEQPEDTLFTIFDFSKHWPLFVTLVTAKARQAAQERLNPQLQYRQRRFEQAQMQD